MPDALTSRRLFCIDENNTEKWLQECTCGVIKIRQVCELRATFTRERTLGENVSKLLKGVDIFESKFTR